MAHTASQRGSGSKHFLIYDDIEEVYVDVERPRKTAQSNFHYREDSEGWKRGRSRRVPRQWARHKRGVGPLVARRMGGQIFLEEEIESADNSWEFLRELLHQEESA